MRPESRTRAAIGALVVIVVIGASAMIVTSDHATRSSTSADAGVLTLAAEPVLTIPDASPTGEWVLSRIAGVTLLSDGGYALTDGTSIHLFDAAGRHTRALGRSGDGPGEFALITSIADCGAGTIAVTDGWLRRLTIFTPDSPPQTNSYPADGVASSTTLLSCEGARLMSIDHTLDANRRTPWPHGVMRQDTLILVARDRALLHDDTLGRIPGHLVLDGLNAPYSMQARVAMNNDWILIGTSSDSVLTLRSHAGSTRTLTVSGLAAVPVTREMREARVAYSKQNTPASIWNNELGAIYAKLVWPTVQPLWSDATIDDESRIWIAEGARPEPNVKPASVHWRVIRLDGTTVGSLTLPPEDRLIAVRGNAVIVVHTNEDETMAVVVRRLIHV